MTFYYYSEANEAEPVPGVRRRMISCGDQAQIIEFCLPKGTVFPLHSHPAEQTSFVSRGRLRVVVGEEESILCSGDGYSVPPGVEHETMAMEDCVIVDVFSPPREEYKDR